MKRVKEVDWRGGGERGRGAGQPGKREKEVKEREGEGEEFFSPDNGLNFVGPKKSKGASTRERERERKSRGSPPLGLVLSGSRERKREKIQGSLFFTLLFLPTKNLKPSPNLSTAPPRIPLRDGFRSQGPRHGRQRPRQPPFGESIMRAEREEVGERREDWREKRNFHCCWRDDGDLTLPRATS